MFKTIKILLTVIFVFFIQSTFANQIDFYWEKDNSLDIYQDININKINNSLENFYKDTGLNTDIVILWKWDECYLESNFDTCVQENHNYSSDLIIIFSMKSDIKSGWDTRTLIKDEFKEVLTPKDFKNMQDQIIPDLKISDFTWWINNYLIYIWEFINNKCIEVWLEKSCDVVKLEREYHNFVTNKEAQKKYNSMMRIFYSFILLLLIIFIYKWFKIYYTKSINNLFKDIKYKITNIWEYKIFEKDRDDILSQLDSLWIVVKNKLWDLDKNTFNLRKFYNDNKRRFSSIELEISNMQKSFTEKEELKDKVEKMKGIDL